jgi:hypothetical protein
VRNEVLRRAKEERNIIHKIKKWKAYWTDYILRRNCILEYVIEGRTSERI